MKTIRRIITLAAIGAISMILQSFEQTPCVVLNGTGGIVAEERQVAGFTAVQVSSGINLEIRKGDNISVRVETNRNIVPYIETKVERGTIYIRVKSRTIITGSRSLNVYITMPTVTELVAMGGSSIDLRDQFKTEGNLYVRASSGSRISGYVESTSMEARTDSGSQVDLEGKVTEKCELMCSSGSTFNGGSLSTNELKVSATSGSDVKIRCEGSINVNASSASKVNYRGKCKVVGLVTNGGAHVRKG